MVREDDGTPTQDKARFKACIDEIKRRCPDIIIQPSTGGGAVGMSDEERLQPTELRTRNGYLRLWNFKLWWR